MPECRLGSESRGAEKWTEGSIRVRAESHIELDTRSLDLPLGLGLSQASIWPSQAKRLLAAFMSAPSTSEELIFPVAVDGLNETDTHLYAVVSRLKTN